MSPTRKRPDMVASGECRFNEGRVLVLRVLWSAPCVFIEFVRCEPFVELRTGLSKHERNYLKSLALRQGHGERTIQEIYRERFQGRYSLQ